MFNKAQYKRITKIQNDLFLDAVRPSHKRINQSWKNVSQNFQDPTDLMQRLAFSYCIKCLEKQLRRFYVCVFGIYSQTLSVM